MPNFIAPEFSYPLAWGIDFSFPVITKFLFQLEEIEISEHDRKMIQSYAEDRLVYFSNHPSTVEPAIAYHVATIMGSRFKYMASRNVFEWGNGFVGEFIKRLGAFSVLSGGADKDSIKMARSILSEPGGKLVIYPEGMTSGENDNLVSFLPGTAQIAFWGYEDAKKKDPKAELFFLPSFVKYIVKGTQSSLRYDIESSLKKIESKLEIVPQTKSVLRRFLTIGRVILEWAELEYRVPSKEGEDYNYRIGKARHAVLERASQCLKIKLPSSMDSISKIRELFTLKDALEAGFKTPEQTGITEKELAMARKDIDLAYTFLILKPEYILERPTAERLLEWIYRFESFVYGKSNFRKRKAVVMFRKPFMISEYYHAYKTNKKAVVEEVMKRIRSDMEEMVKEGSLMTEPLYNRMDEDIPEEFKITPS
jgi:hypothetical protein